jgi:hypothetical protein
MDLLFICGQKKKILKIKIRKSKFAHLDSRTKEKKRKKILNGFINL